MPPMLSLCQESDESLAKFITRVQSGLERKISDPDAHRLLLKSIIWYRMLQDFCRACLALKDEHPDRWIIVIQAIGSSSHQATTMAQAFAAALDKQKGACFQCSCQGLWHNQCSKNKLPPHFQLGSQRTWTLCPRCQRGYHLKSDCHSKTHRNGTPLPNLDLNRD